MCEKTRIWIFRNRGSIIDSLKVEKPVTLQTFEKKIRFIFLGKNSFFSLNSQTLFHTFFFNFTHYIGRKQNFEEELLGMEIRTQ